MAADKEINHEPILSAINVMRQQIRWRSGSASRHLQKRIRRGHLAEGATLADYEAIIQTILGDGSADVYRYWYNQNMYVAIASTQNGQQWLVMFSEDGIMESAFVIERPKHYLSKPGFEYIGRLNEVDHDL